MGQGQRCAFPRSGALSLLLALAGCASPRPASPATFGTAPCTLSSVTVEVPVPPGMVLAVSPEACVLAMEDREGMLLVLTAFDPDDPQAAALRRAPDEVVARLGLLDGARRVTRSAADFLGERVPATGWRAGVAPYGGRDVLSFTSDVLAPRGLVAMLALVVVPPGDADARSSLLALAAQVVAPRPE